jgi:heme/copper-type cytochrome/quinol oxidase subunit 2
VSRKGYEPDALTLRVGEAVRIVLVSGDGEEHCFAVDELRVEKRVRARGPTRFALVPDRTGVFAMHCCLGDSSTAHRDERGEVTVTE